MCLCNITEVIKLGILHSGPWALQAGALISKLTEEKNSVSQQSNRLRQELVSGA
jgi:hypothetical protein